MTDDPPGGVFLSSLVLEHVQGRRYRLARDFAYLTRAGVLIVVPALFVTDGGSFPRFLWWLYPPFGGDYDEAVVIHDYAYAHAEQIRGSDDGHISRQEADDLFRECMDVKGVRESAEATIYAGVRLGGWRPWQQHRAARRRERKGAHAAR